MNTHSSYYPPGPREPDLAALPGAASYPPPASFFAAARDYARWETKPPLSQSRAYVSPDPSPIDETFHRRGSLDTLPPAQAQQPRGFPIPSVFHNQANNKAHAAHRAGFPLPHTQTHEAVEVDPWYNPVMVAPPKQHRRSSKAAKKVEGKQPTFLTKLYAEQPEYHHIIRWDETGESIIIEKPDELADKILPVVYRQSRFASFSRQLNIYGFNRKLSLRHVEPGVYDPDASTWSHPFLRRSSSKDEILGFKRRVPPRPSQAQKRRQSMQDEGMSPSSGSDRSFQSPPDPYQHHLLPDVDEEKAFEFHPPNPFAEQRSYLHRGPYLMHDKMSPTSMDFHYESPQDTMEPEWVTEQQMPRTWQMPQRTPCLRLHDTNFNRTPTSNMPQTAPADTTSFPIPIRVTQQHVRTRSVQGEPPSAMLFSPTSPYFADSWLPADASVPANREEQLSISPTSPAYPPGPWAANVADNPIPTHHSMLYPVNPSRFANKPQSLVNNYEYATPGSLSRSSSVGNGGMLAPHSFSALSETSPIDSQTVSPGVYQAGFSIPAVSTPTYVASLSPQRSIARPAATIQNRQERRASINSSPYSPRTKAQPLPLGAGSFTIASRRGIEEPVMGLDLNLGTKMEVDEDEQALPSASIHLADRHPFEGILSGQQESLE